MRLHGSDRLVVAAAGAVALGAFVIRLVPALSYSLWQDEVASARIIVQPTPLDLVRRVAGTESTPPVWYVLGWGTHKLGVPVVDVRLLSVLSGALLAGLVVLRARRFVPLPAAVFAGALTAVGWQFFEHGWELRAYALFALLSFLFVVLLHEAVLDPSRKQLGLLAVCVATGALTHYFFLFTVAAGLSWLLLTDEPRRALRRVSAAVAVGLAPFLIWLPALVHQYQHGKFQWIGPFRVETVAYIDGSLLDRSIDQATIGRKDAAIALGLLALVLIGSVRLWRSSPEGRLIACAALLPVAFSAVVWRLGPHVFAPRNLIGVAPFACIAIAAALCLLPTPIGAAAAAAGTAIAFINYYDTRAGPPDYHSVSRALVEEGWQAPDPILIFGPFFAYFHPLDWYLPGHPQLRVATPRTNRRCSVVYVVSVGGRGRALANSGDLPPLRIKSILVGRVPWRRSLWRELSLRHGAIAASGRQVPRCVRVRTKSARSTAPAGLPRTTPTVHCTDLVAEVEARRAVGHRDGRACCRQTLTER